MREIETPRRWLLVFDHLCHGGIQTLIVRLANELVRAGKQVALVCREGDLGPLLCPDITLIDAKTRIAMRAGARAWLERSAEPVAMISFDPISSAYGLNIETMRGKLPMITHISGVYHQRAYFMTGERRDRVLLNRLVAAAVGYERLYFQNRECRDAHERRWNVSLSRSPIVPLGIQIRSPRWKPRDRTTLRVISVGRLVDFKAYNLGAAAIVRDCATQDVRLRWDIYGNGPLAKAINAEINKLGVSDSIHLRGELPYENFSEAVTNYDLFVGCGTAALEAAMLGSPVLAVTDSERRATYGFLDELPFGNTGELQGQPPTFDLADLIIDFAKSARKYRTARAARCRRVALSYSMQAMLVRLEGMIKTPATTPSLAFKRAVSLGYDTATASPLANLARSMKRWVQH